MAVDPRNLRTAKDRRDRGLVPNVFGTYAGTEAVALLGTHGTLRASFVEERRDVSVRPMELVAGLVARGLIRTDWARREQNYRLIVASLNETHLASAEIAALGSAMGRCFALPLPGPRAKAFRPPFVPKSSAADVRSGPADALGSGARQRVLLSIAALGKKRAMQVRAASQTILPSLVAVIDILEASGLVNAQRHRNTTRLSLNERWECADELRALLSRLLELNPEYADIAALMDGGSGRII